VLKVFEAEDVADLDGGDEAEAEEESEDAADGADERDLGDLLLRDVLRDVGVLDPILRNRFDFCNFRIKTNWFKFKFVNGIVWL
jgi:hypothetical protein